jgi:hypothetical protein
MENKFFFGFRELLVVWNEKETCSLDVNEVFICVSCAVLHVINSDAFVALHVYPRYVAPKMFTGR